MLLIPNAVFAEYVTYLNYKKIPESRFADYKKWLRYYLDYSDKYPLPHTPSERIRLFCAKLNEKKQSDRQQEQAAAAVSLYFEMMRGVWGQGVWGHGVWGE